MELELRHIVPYLPYGLIVRNLNFKWDYVSVEYSKLTCLYFLGNSPHYKTGTDNVGGLKDCKPLLRPLSDLTQNVIDEITGYKNHWDNHISFDGKNFTFIFEGDISYDGGYEFEKTTQVCEETFDWIQELFKRHYDYFGLIQLGLAIDLNTIQ